MQGHWNSLLRLTSRRPEESPIGTQSAVYGACLTAARPHTDPAESRTFSASHLPPVGYFYSAAGTSAGS